MSNVSWKTVLIALAGIALAVSVYFNWPSEDVPQSDWAYFVDISDGSLYRAPQQGRSYLTRMTHPETGERTLFRVLRDEETGNYAVSTRYIPDDAAEIPGFTDTINPSTGELLVTVSNPQTIRFDFK